MASKVRVHAKSLKWAALGIIDAYVKMYPHATLEDLNKTFPNRELGFGTDRDLLMTQKGLEKFVASTESTKDDEMLANWKETDYFVTMADGTKISFKPLYIWTKEKFQKLESMAKRYDVEVASFEEWQAGKKGSYSLEYLNGYVPPVTGKKSNKWLWIALGILALLALIFFFLGKSCSEEKVVPVVQNERVSDTDEENLNVTKHEQNEVDETDDANANEPEVSIFSKKKDPFSADMVKVKVEGTFKGTFTDFYISKYEVTQAQWLAVMGTRPSEFYGDNNPVENVSLNDIQEFLKKLNAMTGKKYRLPTSAEWAFAAKGGSRPKGYLYAGSDSVDEVAWCGENSDRKTHPVGKKKPNSLGLYDMSGNVYEWCENGDVRGGSWNYGEGYCAVSNRECYPPSYHSNNLGFRLAL